MCTTGAYLNTPVKHILSNVGENEHLVFGMAQMQGWRSGQEDAHNCVLKFDDTYSLFAIYDGHGGAEVSTLSSRHLPSFIKKSQERFKNDLEKSLVDAFMAFDESLLHEPMRNEMALMKPKNSRAKVSSDDRTTKDSSQYNNSNQAVQTANVDLNRPKLCSRNSIPCKNRSNVLFNASFSSSSNSFTSVVIDPNKPKNRPHTGSTSFFSTDINIERKMVSDTIESSNGWSTSYIPAIDSGSTACVVLLKGKRQVHVANIGDSRCVLARASNMLELSIDHKPDEQKERLRIENAGGWLGVDGRVNDVLNLSRCFGDHAAKSNTNLPQSQQIVVAYPDIKSETLLATDKFIVLACDGIWNSLTSQELVDLISLRMSKGLTPVQVCEEVCEMCLSSTSNGIDDTGCDNMTIIIVKFKY